MQINVNTVGRVVTKRRGGSEGRFFIALLSELVPALVVEALAGM